MKKEIKINFSSCVSEDILIVKCPCGEKVKLKEEQTLNLNIKSYKVGLCPKCKTFFKFEAEELEEEELKEVEEWLN
jgi:hypothetical protein